MAVKLDLYRVFSVVAEKGSLTLAAEELFISQSAVSQSLKQLEGELKVTLFSRNRKGVELTSEGRLLYEYVSHAMGLIKSGEEKLALCGDLMEGTLTIGASDTVTKTYLLSRLEAFHKNYPGIRIRILNGTSSMVLDYLRAGQVDIAFASEPVNEKVFSTRHCVNTHTIFIAATGADMNLEKTYSMEEIAALPLILLERKSSSRVHVEDYFMQHGIRIHPEIELGSHNLLISLARIGLGVACVTEEFSWSALGRGVITPLKTDFEIPARAVVMCTLQAVTPSKVVSSFMDFVTESNRIEYDPGHSYHFSG